MRLLSCALVLLAASQAFAAVPDMSINDILSDLSSSSTATAQGDLTVIVVPASTVAETLPDGLRLSPRLMQADGTYPVAMFIGTHHNLTWHSGLGDIVVAKQYNEATFTMTVLSPKGDEYSYTSRILVDSVPALVMGRILGYPKVLANVKVEGESFQSKDFFGNPMVTSTTSLVQNPNGAVFLQNLQYLAGEMRPTITKTLVGFVCFNFEWALASGTLAPASVNVQLTDTFMGKDLGGQYESPSLDAQALGSMSIQSDWKMSGFHLCN